MERETSQAQCHMLGCPAVLQGDLELDYHNFVVLTGNISSMVRDGQRFSCSLRVARTPAATEPGQVQQYDT